MQLTNTAAFTPGAPSGNVGPSHPPSVYDHLPVSRTSTVGKTDTASLRRSEMQRYGSQH